MAAITEQDREFAAFIEKATQLTELMAHHAWPVFEGLVRELRSGYLEELASAKDPAELRHIQGAARVLGQLLALPGEIRDTAAELAREADRAKPGISLDELRQIMGTSDDEPLVS